MSAQSPASASAPVERPLVELAGCRHVTPGRCTLPAGTAESVRVWIDVHAKASVRVMIDDEPIELEPVAADGGQRLRFDVPPQAERLRIMGEEPPWTDAFELRFDREQVPAVVTNADAAARAGQHETGIELLRAALPKLEGTARLAALQKLRRLLAAVDPSEAAERTREAAALAKALGRTRDLADCAAAAAWTALASGDLLGARDWTAQLDLIAAELHEARVWARYYAGALAIRTGDLGRAVRLLDDASRLARRLDMTRELQTSNELLANVLAELGRSDEALLVARELLGDASGPAVPCGDRARALGNVAWINMLLAEAGRDHDPPRPLLEQQLALVREGGQCPDPNHTALVNLAIIALAEHEPEEAWAWLGEQRASGVPEYLRAWVDELGAQVGVATGRDELVPALVELPGHAAIEPSLRWMAFVRHARTLEALGLGDAAVASYLDAEAILEQSFRQVGVDVGAELFLSGRGASAEGLVELLVARGEVEAAFCRARLARGRALRTVDRQARIASLSPDQRSRREELLFAFLATQTELSTERREDWKFSASEREHRERRRKQREDEAAKSLDEALRLVGNSEQPSSCAELPEQAPGVVTLLQFPRPEGGAWMFVADIDGVAVRAAPDPGDPSWSEALLDPFGDRIAAAASIRILPTGSGWSLPFHALPFRGGVLLDVAPVVYTLDLPARATRPRPPGTAVVISNPSKDLPEAFAEANDVARRLTLSDWQVVHHVEADASRARLTESFADATLLHYAGHGTHGGVDGWGAALLLHDGDRLTVADILALPQVPDMVVLSGCDTATLDQDAIAGGMNLGRAFVLAGASWVIAADGPVDDALARAIGVDLYQGTVPTTGFDGAQALRRAQLRLRTQHSTRWHAFRVVVP